MKNIVRLFVLLVLLLDSELVLGQIDPSDDLDLEPKTVLKILVHNVGGSDFSINNYLEDKLHPNCPLYKLCHTEIIDRVRTHLIEHAPDVVFYQEILSIQQLLIGSAEVPPILPENYTVQCGRGAGSLHEICISWRRDKFQSVGECSSIETGEGGALKCTLKSSENGKFIDFINVHPSAFLSNDRRKLLNDVWTVLVDYGNRTIIGGDFNTFETFPKNTRYPYPDSFGTIFGRTVQSYGRWKTKQTFYGYRKISVDGGVLYRKVAGSTIIRRKIDHLFANFGQLGVDADFSTMPCKNSVCLGNVDGYDWGFADWSPHKLGPKTDHLPILANIIF